MGMPINYSFPTEKSDPLESWKYCVRCGRVLTVNTSTKIQRYNPISGEPYINVNIKCPLWDEPFPRDMPSGEPWHVNATYIKPLEPPEPVSLGYLKK
jgi:hypothetical protein